MKNTNRYPLETLFGRVLSPFESFLQQSTSGGILLICATAIALVVATCIGDEAVHNFWEQSLEILVSHHFALKLSWHQWVNDGLMALFFLLVGLELKREILVGELASLRNAALPVLAAVGGMILPAAIYSIFNAGTLSVAGWGIPMATDIAFAIGILILLGSRAPKNLVIFLTALAIADDLGAVLAIAVFYTSDLNINALYSAGLLLSVLFLFNRGGVRHPLPYALVGLFLWYAVLISGIHATLAGILLAIAIPAKPAYTIKQFQQRVKELDAELEDECNADSPNDLLNYIQTGLEHPEGFVWSWLLRRCSRNKVQAL